MHQSEPFIKSFSNFNDIRFYRQLKSSILAFAAGVFIWMIVLSGLSFKYFLYFGSFLIAYSFITVISEFGYKQKLTKLITLRSNQLKDNLIQYSFGENDLFYKEQLMETRTSWNFFKGFVVHKDCIYILPEIEVFSKHMIVKSSLGNEDFERCITSLRWHLNQLDVKDLKK